MKHTEEVVVFDCDKDQLVGILHRPAVESDIGVMVVVGGPQYRVGSHRQFVHLGRDLAEAGIAVFRFDYRGMGDASGECPGFADCGADIAAASIAFRRIVPSLRHVVHWGLCDGASAIAIHAASDPRPYALIMVNPWVRSDESLAKARMKSYYLVHIMQIDFWRRLIRGGVDIKGRLRDFWVNLLRALRKETRPPAAAAPFQDRMSGGLMDFAGSVLLILSGRDITAAEFDTSIRRSHRWERAFRACDVTREIMPDADHTFSNRTASRMAARISAQWIRKL